MRKTLEKSNYTISMANIIKFDHLFDHIHIIDQVFFPIQFKYPNFLFNILESKSFDVSSSLQKI